MVWRALGTALVRKPQKGPSPPPLLFSPCTKTHHTFNPPFSYPPPLMWLLTFQKLLMLLKMHQKMQNGHAIICPILAFFLPLVFWLPPTANTSHIPEWSRTPVVIYKREWWLTRVVVEEKEMDAIFPRSHLCVFCPHIIPM